MMKDKSITNLNGKIIYSIHTRKKWEFCQAVNGHCPFRIVKGYRVYLRNNMEATTCVGQVVQVRQKSGNCADALDSILDQFPGSHYIIDEEKVKRIIGGF